jgi:two-component system chemotaxis sensor kinase CheA
MSENRQAFNERLAQVFKQETQGRLDTMRLLLKEIESLDFPQAAFDKLMSLQLEIHSLKGAARSVEQYDIEMLCQEAETLLIKARGSEIKLSTEMLQGLRELIDYLDHVVLQSSPEVVGIDSNSLHLKLRRYCEIDVNSHDDADSVAARQGEIIPPR